jgi:hypothetical protein
MSYQNQGAPMMDTRRTIMTAEETVWARGWVLDGWSMVQLVECGNWAVLEHGERGPVSVHPVPYEPEPWWTAPPVVWGGWGRYDPPRYVPPPETPHKPFAPIPLPAGAWLLTGALAVAIGCLRIAEFREDTR